MKSETKKLLIGLGIVGIFLLMSGISIYRDVKKADDYVEIVDKALESNERTLIYLGKEECGYCAMLNPYLDGFKKSYEFDYEYIDTTKANVVLPSILEKLEVEEEGFGTPYLVVVEDGKIVDSQAGYVEENVLFEFLQDNKFIDEDAKMLLSYVDYNEYKDLLESGDKEILVITQTGCTYCEQAKPVLEEVASEYGADINIVNITNFTEEEKTEFGESLDYLNENEWGTPLVLIVKNSEVRDTIEGLKTAEEYAEVFKNNGLL